MTIQRIDSKTGFDALLAEITGVAHEVGDLIFGPAGLVDQHNGSLLSALMKTFSQESVGIISLKQIRDAAEPERACYQALVLTQFKIDRWLRRGLVAGDYAARIVPAASMPIVEALGLRVGKDGRVRTEQPFMMEYDCSVSSGTNLYIAP